MRFAGLKKGKEPSSGLAMTRPRKRLLKDEDGQVLVVTILSMGILVGAMGLALDVGILFRARRNMQIAADAAAMAGATALFYGGNVTDAANGAATANGVDPSVVTNTVIVTQNPSVGGTPCASCVQVQLAKPNPTIFMSTLSKMTGGNSFGSVNVAAKAIAGAPSAGQACVYIMDPTAAKALHIHGAGNINMPDCGVYVNSNASNALCVTGSAGKSTFPWIDVVGGQPTNGNCGGSLNGNTSVNLSSPVQSDPFGNITGPVPDTNGNCSGINTTTDSTTKTINTSYSAPSGGTVCFKNGITLSSGATLGGGLYVFENGLTIGMGSVTVGSSTNGATLDIYGGSYSQSSASSLTIYAPTSGTYNAIALMQPANNTNALSLQFGSSGSTFDGMIYAPAAHVTLHDQGGGGVTATGVVAATMFVNGAINIQNYADFGNNKYTSPFRLVVLIG